MEDKKSLRAEVRRRIKLMSDEEKQRNAATIFAKVEATVAFANANCIALFVALWDEVPTTEALERWRAMGKRVVVPRVEGDIMRYYDYHPDKMAVGAFGIIEPTGEDEVSAEAIDLMIVPARAFTPKGDRLGRGGGFYDKYMSLEGFRAVKYGVAYACQIFDSLPTDPHDIPVDKVFTDL
jgi:5-formyltetrahydrofolate cyclo-ligase